MAKPKFVVFHRMDQNNVGDMYSNPLRYFLKPDEYQTIDITHVGSEAYPYDVPVIAGGGGLIGNELFGENLLSLLNDPDKNTALQQWRAAWEIVNPTNANVHHRFLEKLQPILNEYLNSLENRSAPTILWGAGTNEDVGNKRPKSPNYPGWLNFFSHVGLRDWTNAYKWAPCASCMHPSFNQKYPIKNKVIWFEHKKQLIKSSNFGPEPVPRFVNSGANMEQTIELLGSANTILTNSYHGAYWGTLLGKKVIVLGPWSSKFYSLKHKPYLLGKPAGWLDAVDEAPIYPNALEEARNATKDFWTKVKAVL